MKLIVFYSYRELTDFDEEILHDKYLIVNVPEDLFQSEFKEYVYKNYFDQILNLENDCCSGEVLNLGIDKIEYITELNLKEIFYA